MANNRMWLIHKPSQLGVLLAKRMGIGWYDAPSGERLNRFYDYLEAEFGFEGQDDFVLAMEDCKESSCFDNWKYTDEKIRGFRKFEILKEDKS